MPLTTADRLEILDLLARYNHAHDFDDINAWVTTFAPDAEFITRRSTSHGHEELRRFFLAGRERLSDVRHWIGNVVIAGDGNRATSHCYMLLFQQVEGRSTLRLSGSYDDELRRIDGSWKIARRKITIDQGPDA